MDAMTILLLVRSLGELIEGIPAVLKILERAVSGEKIPKEEIERTLGSTAAASNKWRESVQRAAERGFNNAIASGTDGTG